MKVQTNQHKDLTSEENFRGYLFLSVVFVIIAFFGLIGWSMGGAMLGMRFFMATFFIVFGTMKLVNIRMFAESFVMYDLISQRIRLWAYSYPFVELMLGVAYMLNLQIHTASLLTAVISGIGVVGVSRELRKDRKLRCACLGNVVKLPLSKITLIEDGVMFVMAVAMIMLGK